MLDSSFARFVVTVVVAFTVVFLLSAIFTPPDPISQLLTVGLLTVVALPIAYYLSYRGGFRSISKRVNR
jgi:ABC-type iron transport system FetAB permease component